MVKWNEKSLLSKEIDMIIDSDASLMGWGAVCQNQPVSVREPDAYKLPRVVGSHTGSSDISETQNQVASPPEVGQHLSSGIHKQPVSPELVDLAKTLWMWCLEQNIHITAQHLPGAQNHIANAESRTMVDRN